MEICSQLHSLRNLLLLGQLKANDMERGTRCRSRFAGTILLLPRQHWMACCLNGRFERTGPASRASYPSGSSLSVNEHLAGIYADIELDREPTIRSFRIVQTKGSRGVSSTRLV